MNVEHVPQSYGVVTARLQEHLRPFGCQLEALGQVDGYPIYRADVGPADRPRLLFSAGIHGEEPASVLGLLAWLGKRLDQWADRLHLTILPCLNPYGFERGERSNAAGVDPNRQWRRPEDPLRHLIARSLAGESFDLVLDLHEDSDFFGFYTYEICRTPPRLGPRLVAAAGRLGPVAHHEPLEEGLEIDQGYVEPLEGDAIEPFLREMEEWPIAFYYVRHADRILTVETPGRQPLSLRVAMQQAVMDETVAFVREQS